MGAGGGVVILDLNVSRDDIFVPTMIMGNKGWYGEDAVNLMTLVERLSDIDDSQTSACAVLAPARSRCGTLLLPFHCSLFFGRRYREKIDSPALAAGDTFFPCSRVTLFSLSPNNRTIYSLYRGRDENAVSSYENMK